MGSYATGLHGRTRDPSPRQLPTNHDHDGGPCARSTNIRVINRRRLLPRPLFPESWTYSLRQRDSGNSVQLQARISLERKESHDEEIPPQSFCGI